MVSIGTLLAQVHMINEATVAAAAGMAALGTLLLIAGWQGLFPRYEVVAIQTDRRLVRTGLAVAGGLGMLLFTSWPVAAFFGALAGWFALTLRSAKQERKDAVDRVDAIASWVESVRDNIAGAAGLQQAIRVSAEHAPEAIRREVRDLVACMQHESLTVALRRFAVDVAHPTADMVVACLILATARTAGGLAQVLTMTAQSARDSATMMRQVEAGRAATQSQSKLVAAMTSFVSFGMIATRREFVAPFGSAGGQIFLFIICAVATGATVMLHQLSKPAPVVRLFGRVETWESSSTTPEIAAEVR